MELKLSGKIKDYLRQVTILDCRSLALFRIMLGIVTIVDLLDRASVFEIMYSENGLIPLEVVREMRGHPTFGVSHFSLHMLNGSQIYQAGLFWIAGLCAACVTLGYRTRFFVIASWFLHASIMTRNPVYFSGADVTLGLALFWAIFLPLSNQFSIDRFRGRAPDSLGGTALRVGVACYLLQLLTIYVCAAYAKDFTWRNGTALMHILQMDLLASDFGRYLTNYPAVLWGMTLGAWWLEALGTLLLFTPWGLRWGRGLCFLSFFSLHAGIALTCDIGLFPFFSMVLWLPIIPGGVWDWFGVHLAQAAESEPGAASARSVIKNKKQTITILVAASSIIAVMLTTFPVGNLGLVSRVSKAYVSRLKLSQNWTVFAKTEYLERDGWFIVEGTLKDGETVDLLRNYQPVQWSRPPLSGPRRVPVIWRTYLARQERSKKENLHRYASYLHRKQKLIDGHGFDKIRMLFMKEDGLGQDIVTQNVFWSGNPAVE